MNKFCRIAYIVTQAKYRRFFITICCTTIFFNLSATLNGQTALHTIVIDPGHGGIDIGCHGELSYEKNVALGVSLKLAEYLHKNWPDVKVVLTRSKDAFVDLGERAEIANRVKADLFICVHCNANPNHTAFGTETYVMGLHKTQGNLLVAQRENQSIKYEKDYKTKYDGFDPNSAEAYILLAMNQSAYLDQSIYLASKIEEDFLKTKRYSRGVKQAGFLVLWRTTMPALLCETGFLTNPEEEKYLISTKGQYEIAGGIFDAIKKYRAHYDKLSDTIHTLLPDSFIKWRFRNAALRQNDSIKILNIPNVKTDSQKYKTVVLTKDTSAPKNNFVYYRVQVSTLPAGLNASTTFSNIKYNIIREPTVSKNIRITAGNFYSYDEVKVALDSIRRVGYKDAFIVEYHNGKRVREIYK